MELKGFYAENAILAKYRKDSTNYGFTHRALFYTASGELVDYVRDKTGTVLTNPILSNPDGYFEVMLPNGTYTVAIEGSGWNYRIPMTFSDVGNKIPLLTDGRSLSRLKAKMAKVATEPVRICLGGDSYHEYTSLPQHFADKLYAKYGKHGDGFMSIAAVQQAAPINGVLFVRNGWSSQDASTGAAIVQPVGIDGQSAFTTTTTATMTLSNFTATDVEIYYMNTGGSFEYRIDSGSWIPVETLSNGTFDFVSVTGLTNTTHILSIRTTNNTGTVVLLGFRVRNSASAGIEIHKVGNAGSTGPHTSMYAPYVGPLVNRLQPDLLIFNLGGNDISTANSNPTVFAAGIHAIVDAYRAIVPNISIILSFPPKVNRTIVNDPKLMRDTMYNLAMELEVEFSNNYDAFGEWADMNALGLFDDTIHPSQLGGTIFYDRIIRELF